MALRVDQSLSIADSASSDKKMQRYQQITDSRCNTVGGRNQANQGCIKP